MNATSTLKKRFSAGLLILLLAALPLQLQAGPAEQEPQQLRFTEWLQAGPVLQILPAWHDVSNIRGNTFGLRELMDTELIDPAAIDPVSGTELLNRFGTPVRWREVRFDSGDASFSRSENERHFHTYYLATQLHTSRWTESTLKLTSPHTLALYVNGERMNTKTSIQTGDAEAGTLSQKLQLERGRHTIMVKIMAGSDAEVSSGFSAELEYDALFEDAFAVSTSPQRPLSLTHLMTLPETTGVSISADGTYVAVVVRQGNPDTGSWDNWIELRRFETGETVQTWRGGMRITGINWSHKDHVLTYTTRSGNKGTIWKIDLQAGTHEPILRDVEHLGGHQWGPDNRFLLYTAQERPAANNTGVHRLDGMHDRYPTWRHRSFIFRLDPATGARERLTAGLLSTGMGSISPDGTQLVLSRTHVDYSTRPFTYAEMLLMDLRTLETETIIEAPWIGGGSFSPDGRHILLTGSPNAFGDTGRTVEGLANDYDSQAYLFDLQTREVRSITRQLDPDVSSAQWGHDGRHIYITGGEKSRTAVFRYDLRNDRFERLDTGVDVTSGFTVASNARRAAYIGHGINDPHKAYTFDLRRDRATMIHFAAADTYRHVRFGSSRDWVFTLEDGTEIDGHVYYPIDFDDSKTYPVIVYYYGGTAPVSRAFSGRYPKELYAAHGYIVYVLQPSGTTGFGQEFSQRHLNDWGRRVSGEIIASVNGFLDAHTYADRERVGAIGASFGGFMTMLLLTETDMFAAAVSHAGISNITSYWGDGFWGYLYSSVASANSFPWDAPEVYIDQSPIFRADRVRTPLLLLHGLSDTNVPPSESMQFFTALTLLGADVEYVTIADQDHHIVDYNKFMLWKNTIISYFDRYLKEQPEWWNHKYSE
ncbi:MAG: prolyl oligopeptidase family serine peptidase [Candidatus Cyclonatronum sp.]|uniref:S9 family peptidase n=1 Tax=Cyclonatronum sp. TaxID=3024185 RepID=UPI0025C35BFB|nr:prolyl oligopeptidase family serine peptidase [Cyclonatronum sp.]MCH8486928.1 prolyl oligopeptidase family serine peptidase [Cyclonatronum sp.]